MLWLHMWFVSLKVCFSHAKAIKKSSFLTRRRTFLPRGFRFRKSFFMCTFLEVFLYRQLIMSARGFFTILLPKVASICWKGDLNLNPLSLFSALSLWKLELLGKSFQFTLWHSTKSCLWESESSQTTKAYYFEGRRLYSAFFSGGPSTSYSSGGSLGLLLLTNQGPLLTIRYAIWIMLSCQLFISLACYWSTNKNGGRYFFLNLW